jgi:hypothetical protein
LLLQPINVTDNISTNGINKLLIFIKYISYLEHAR